MKSLIVIVVLMILQTNSFSQSIQGAWKRDLDTAIQYLTIVDNYFSIATFNVSEKRADRCTDCNRISSRKVTRPSYEQLLEDSKKMSMVNIGKKYGVSDNAIRKWINAYKKK